MTESQSRRPQANTPMPALISEAKIKTVLESRFQNNKFSYINQYDPADGVNTHERRMLYRRLRMKEARRALWYHVHQNTIKKIRRESCPMPIVGQCDSDQVYNMKERYVRSRGRGFAVDPWNRASVDEKFETLSDWRVNGTEASVGVRKGWTFERGFSKTYRLEPQWRDTNFDEEALAPEETAPGVQTRAWKDEYNKRHPLKPGPICPIATAATATTRTHSSRLSSHSSETYYTDADAQSLERRVAFGLKLRKFTMQLSAMAVSTESLGDHAVCGQDQKVRHSLPTPPQAASLTPFDNLQSSENEAPVDCETSGSGELDFDTLTLEATAQGLEDEGPSRIAEA